MDITSDIFNASMGGADIGQKTSGRRKEQTMSKDTIYREDAIEAIHREARIVGGSVAIEYADMFQDAINALPSADRPQGEWIYTNNPLRLDDEWKCSRCGNISFAKTNYCDKCGCRMRKENE